MLLADVKSFQLLKKVIIASYLAKLILMPSAFLKLEPNKLKETFKKNHLQTLTVQLTQLFDIHF